MDRCDRESANSSIIGVILLIAITIITGSIVLLIVNSQPLPEKVPMAYLGISKTSEGVEVINKAGDTLTSTSITILVDGADRTNEFRSTGTTPGWGTLKAGEHISYASATTPQSVQVIYGSSAGRYLLASNGPAINPSLSPLPTPAPVKTIPTGQDVNARMVSTTIPATMNSGQRYPVSVTVKNTGSMSWNEATMIRLGAVGDGAGDAYKFGPARIDIPAGTSVSPGSSYIFTFTLTAPATHGTFTPEYQMVWEGEQWFGEQASPTVTVSGGPTVNAQLVATSLPVTMNTGQRYPVSVTMKNTGSMAWNETTMIRLGAVGDGAGDAARFGPVRVTIPAGTSVSPGSNSTFIFTMTAPDTAVTFTPEYRMVWEGEQWFGEELSQKVTVSGGPTVNAQLVATSIPASMNAGQSYPVSVTMKNTGSMTWNEASMIRLGGVGDGMGDARQFGPARIYLPPGTSVSPGSHYTFTFTMTAPAAPGTSSPRYRMVWEGQQWFGEQVSQTVQSLGPGMVPHAQFSVNSAQNQSPLIVQFTDMSTGTGPLTYSWDFHNEGTVHSTEQSPTHTYYGVGLYSVKLTVTNAYGSDTEIKTPCLEVLPPVTAPVPTAQFTATTTQGQSPLPVQFTDLSVSTGTTSYQWDINNDGVTDYTAQNPSHTYPAAGNYTVKFTVTNASGSDSEIKTQYIRVSSPVINTPPIAQFTASPLQGHSPLVVQFTDQSVSTGTTSYQWDINNDGVTDYTVQNPSHTYPSAGNYTIKLTVSNAFGSTSEIKTNYIKVASLQSGDCYGAVACNPTGNPIGGGAGYSRIISGTEASVKYLVTTKVELLAALKTAKAGETVFVKGTAVIDMTGTPSVTIPAGVTLASDRGAGSAGGLLKRTKNLNGGWEEPMLIAGGDYVRVTGLRLEGEMYPQDYGNDDVYAGSINERYYLVGIYAENKKGFEVDNCELYGWAWSTISLRQNGIAPIPYIHHNYIHHNQARGEGYGVNLYGGNALIEANIFDYNRHDVTGAGMAGEQYEARYNRVIGHGTAIGASHFDVHQDEETGTGAAGAKFLIHHNTVDTGTVATVHIRARPTIGMYVDHNIINARDVENGVPGGLPIYQTNSNQNMFVTNNYWMGKLYTTGTGIVWYE